MSREGIPGPKLTHKELTDMKHLLALVVILLTYLCPANGQKLKRAMPDNNLAYPILITVKNGTGSGFFFATATHIYLVTAKHVLFEPNTNTLLSTSFELLSYSGDLSDPTPNLVSIDTTQAGANSIVCHPSHDVAVMKVFSRDVNAGKVFPLPGVTMKLSKGGIVAVDGQGIKKFDEVLVGNEVILLGYPTSLGLQGMPEINPRWPLLRKGIVAGQNRTARSIILDCPAYFGNSGGPVIEIAGDDLGARHFQVIGIVSKYVPYADGGKTFVIMANSGYSVVTPIDFVLDLIK
jgi:S1-C subfamily serine protease